ncbi:FTR1 family protein [Cellvibrio mixtus]|uniref:FTR1 family protein n=1 Tax=Cellvibrio mixtus TaxID=39650 RepID=UPI0005865C3D|nr:FTR1 family protein [Cellvibrio mixtus]
MVDAILLILREVLEAALIITMLLVMSRKLSIAFNWIVIALALGMLSSWLLACYAYAIADAFDGTGQEWINALLYFSVILSFIVIASIIAPLLFNTPSHVQYLPLTNESIKPYRKLIFCAVFAVGLSLAREVAEIWIYVGGFLHDPNLLQSALIGGAIGVGIGTSLGVITYYLLVFISARAFLNILFVFLVLLCGGLSMQIARQLLQIGILDSATPLWDTSSIINEHSWLGELLYALIGYDSSPNAIQVIFYWVAVMPLLLILLWNGYRRNRTSI